MAALLLAVPRRGCGAAVHCCWRKGGLVYLSRTRRDNHTAFGQAIKPGLRCDGRDVLPMLAALSQSAVPVFEMASQQAAVNGHVATTRLRSRKLSSTLGHYLSSVIKYDGHPRGT